MIAHAKWSDLKEHRLAAMTDEERARFLATYEATVLALDVAEKIRAAREAAGMKLPPDSGVLKRGFEYGKAIEV